MSLNARCSRAVAALVFLAPLVFAAPAFAAPPRVQAAPPAPLEPKNAEAMADARFKAGLAAYDRGDYEAARLEFLQAQAIFPRPSLLRNLALSEMHTGRPLDALQHLRTFLADPGTTPDRKALGERTLADAYAQTAHLSITGPDGAHVKVDGRDVGLAPLKEPVDVVAGLHGVDIEVNGASMHESVQAAAGKLSEVAFVAPVVADTRVVVAPGVVAAKPAGPTPGVADAKPAKEPYWNGRRSFGLGIVGVGAVGMAVGGVFGALRGGETTNAATARADISGTSPSTCYNPTPGNTPGCDALVAAHGSNASDAHIEDSMLIGGGLLVAVGLLATFWPGDAEPPPLARVTPVTGPHVAGLSWSGSF